MHQCPANCQLRNSLQDGRRTANAGIGKIKPRLRFYIFFLQLADRRERRSGLTGDGSGAGAVRSHADQAGCGISLIRVIVGGLRGDRP